MQKLISATALSLVTSLAQAQPSEPAGHPSPEHCAAFGATLVGTPYDEGVILAQAKEHKLTIRVVQQDNARYAATMDYRPDRVNLHIQDGKVFQTHCG